MSLSSNRSPLFLVSFALFFAVAHAATIEVRNQCPYTVWAAASWPAPTRGGGGRRLFRGESWTVNVPAGTIQGRIWGRTNCNFDGSGRGSCQTGDCGLLQCNGYGKAPNTLAEFSLNQFAGQDFIDITLVDGFNIPMEFSPTGGCSRTIRCTADINSQCPAQLRAPGGCNNPCTVYNTPQYCCTNGPNTCRPTDLSGFFKERCHDAYSYPQDDATSLFTCPEGTNYSVLFCPSGASTNRSRSSSPAGKDPGKFC